MVGVAFAPVTNHSSPVPPKPFRLRARAASFRHAFRGVGLLVRSQHNAWIHLGATLAVVAAGEWLGLARLEWCAVVLAVASVWAAEALNSGLEFLADEVSAAPREFIGNAKDLGAAGVLLSSLGAAVVGALVFGPHLARWIAPR